MGSLEITQRKLPFTKLTISVNNRRELAIEHKAMFRSSSISYPLQQVAPSLIHFRSIPIPWVVTTAIFSLFLLGSVIDGWPTKGAGEVFGFLLMLGITAACLYNTIQLSQNVLHFKDASNGSVLFTIYRSKPSDAAVDSFLKELRTRIESFHTPHGANQEEAVSLYRRHLEYLLENGVLTKDEHGAVMKRLDERATKRKVVELVR